MENETNNTPKRKVPRKRDNRRFIPNSTYYTISVYVVLTVLVCSVIIRVLFMSEHSIDLIKATLKWSSPYLVAIFLACLLYPMVRGIRSGLEDSGTPEFIRKHSNGIAILFTYVILFGTIALAIGVIIPQAAESFSELTVNIPIWYRKMLVRIYELNKHFPDLDLTFVTDKLQEWGENVVNPSQINKYLESVWGMATDMISKVATTSYSVIIIVADVFIAFVMSIYFLMDHKRISKMTVEIMEAYIDKSLVKKTCQVAGECYEIFAKFVSGKLLDSLIIGLICWVAMFICRIPYAEAISIVVGITNMIPYFGPFIGAIPGCMILIMVSPIKCLIYLILILALQQFDGLVLGPKILGDVTGLRPAWIIFAVAAGGELLGVIGMFIGVPVAAVIGHLLKLLIDHHREARLERERIRLEEEAEFFRQEQEKEAEALKKTQEAAKASDQPATKLNDEEEE